MVPALASLVASQVVNYSLRCRRWRRDGTLAALCSSVPKSSTENTLHVKIYDNLLHSLSDLNDTTCPWPLRGTVADLAAFVVAGGALSCFMTAGGAAGDDGAVGLATFDLRWRCKLPIYHDRFTCVWLYCAILFANVFYAYLSNKRFLTLLTLTLGNVGGYTLVKWWVKPYDLALQGLFLLSLPLRYVN